MDAIYYIWLHLMARGPGKCNLAVASGRREMWIQVKWSSVSLMGVGRADAPILGVIKIVQLSFCLE